MVGDVTYVGNRGVNLMGAFQGGQRQNLNSVDYGAAYLPQNQDPTLGTNAVPGQTAYTSNLLRPFRGLAGVEENQTAFYDIYHSVQMNLNRRFRGGFSFGANYTYGISLKGNTGLNLRMQHGPDGKISIRSDQAQFEKQNETLDVRPHLFKANGIWNSPNMGGKPAALRLLVRDWQVSTVMTFGSGAAYNLGYSYQNNGSNVNITGSPDWAGKVTLANDLGSGCSDNQFGQFKASAVRGPAYGSLGLESGRNYLRGCMNKNVDLSLVRRIRVSTSEKYQVEIRADVFNAGNFVVINGRNNSVQFDNPASMTVVNNQFNADGSVNQARLQPKNAGFGAANSAQALRTLQLQLRLRF
jgi:hypothetical protein